MSLHRPIPRDERSSLPEIASVQGHKQLDMVRRYAHLSPQHTAKVVSKMTERMFGGTPGA